MDKFSRTVTLALLVSAPLCAPAFADGDDLDVTVTVVEADGTVEDVVNVIELPEEASDVARESAAFGLSTANSARQRGEQEDDEKLEDSETAEAMAGGVADRAEESVKNAEGAAREAAANANEAAEEALKNALSGGAEENVPEDVLDNIPEDVRDRLPLDPDSAVDDATDNIPDDLPGNVPGS